MSVQCISREYAYMSTPTRKPFDPNDLSAYVPPKFLQQARDERSFLIRLAHNTAIDLMRRREVRSRSHVRFGVEQMSPFAPATDPDERAFRVELLNALGQRRLRDAQTCRRPREVQFVSEGRERNQEVERNVAIHSCQEL